MNDNARGALALGARFISIKVWAIAGLVAFIALIFLMAPAALVAMTQTGSGMGAAAATGVSDAVPAAYRDDILKAGSICEGISPALIAARGRAGHQSIHARHLEWRRRNGRRRRRKSRDH